MIRRDKVISVLWELYKKTGIVDNGYCAVCRIGHRLWKKSGADGPAEPCDNPDCISHQVEEILKEAKR